MSEDTSELTDEKHDNMLLEELTDLVETNSQGEWMTLMAMVFSAIPFIRGAIILDPKTDEKARRQPDAMFDFFNTRMNGTNWAFAGDDFAEISNSRLLAENYKAQCDKDISTMVKGYVDHLDPKNLIRVAAEAYATHCTARMYRLKVGIVSMRRAYAKQMKTPQGLKAADALLLDFAEDRMERWDEAMTMLKSVLRMEKLTPNLAAVVDMAKRRYDNLIGEGMEPKQSFEDALGVVNKWVKDSMARKEKQGDAGGNLFDFGAEIS